MHEVLEAGIEVSLLTECTDAPKMRMVYVRINPEQPLEYGLDYLQEV